MENIMAVYTTIGKTKSRKFIYKYFEHVGHKNFTAKDHTDAALLHLDNAISAEFYGSIEKRDYSIIQSNLHYNLSSIKI